MSTNFYIKKNSEENEDDSIHIGKRVCGWQFIFSNYKKTGADWIKFLKENSESIYDEYNRKLTFKELEENAFPDQDAYTLINSEFMYDLLKNGVGIYSNDEIVDSLERDFAELTPEQWANLKEFGKLKQRGILFLKNNKLRLTSREAIDEVAKDLEHYPNYRLRIEGHTGTLGDSIKNKK